MDRTDEIDVIVNRVTRWAAGRADVVGLVLVGSVARDAAGPDSDVDLVVLTDDEAAYADDAWIGGLALGTFLRRQSWGAIVERRFVTASGLEVEIGIGGPGWASTEPVDPGTRRVVVDGARILHDPAGVVALLLEACRR